MPKTRFENSSIYKVLYIRNSNMTISKSEAGKLGYLASKKSQEKNKKERINNYYKNPTKCLCCEKELDYDHRHNKFCDQSCAAKYNNPKKTKKRFCVCCNNVLKESQKKYCCKECENKNKRLLRYKKHILDNGDIIGCCEQTARRIAKDYLEEKFGHKCAICGNSEWLGKPILLIADHIDGDPSNNNINNYRLICSNCDATLDTYKNKNKNKQKRTYRKKYYKARVGERSNPVHL